MIESPVVGTISSMLFSFNSRSQSYLEPFPQFIGAWNYKPYTLKPQTLDPEP